jgi:RNA polymerase sigma-70 factor (ECF subfamily)
VEVSVAADSSAPSRRRRSRRIGVTPRADAEETDGTQRLALVALVALESERALARLRSLPAEQARAVALAVIGGCAAAEVGRHEDIPRGTAKTRIRTGLRRLRETLKEGGRDGTRPRRGRPPRRGRTARPGPRHPPR